MNTPNQDAPESEQDGEITAQKSHPLRWLRTSFLTGVVIAAPIAITIYVTLAFIGFVDDRVVPLIPVQYNPETYLPFSIPGFGVLIAVVALTVLGALTANLFGRSLLSFGERLVDRMPIVRVVYNTVKQIFETIVSQDTSNFTEVGLIEYPRPGLYALCFITSSTSGEVQANVEEDLVSVFLPTTPNPTSGFLLFVPLKDIKILKMSVEEGAKIVISAGLIEPEKNGAVVNIDPEGMHVPTDQSAAE